jgi:hypothetical protein
MSHWELFFFFFFFFFKVIPSQVQNSGIKAQQMLFETTDGDNNYDY